MSRIFLSCGHEDKVRPNGWPLTTVDGSGVSYSHVCLPCFQDTLRNRPEDVLFGEYEVAERLGYLRDLEERRLEEHERAEYERLAAKYAPPRQNERHQDERGDEG